jgi:hypothetical protein
VPPTPTGTPTCGTVIKPCYTQIQLPTINEGGGGSILALLVLYGVFFPFVGLSARLVLMIGLVFCVGLFVVSTQYGWLYGYPALMISVLPFSFLGNIFLRGGKNR